MPGSFPFIRRIFHKLPGSQVLVHYVVGEIFLWHMSPKPVSREFAAPLVRDADNTSK